MRRSRLLYLALAGAMAALGLASRRYTASLPAFIAQYSGDTLWALTAFVGIGLVAPRWPTWRVAGAALVFAYAIEASQLYHAPWIDQVRRTTGLRNRPVSSIKMRWAWLSLAFFECAASRWRPSA